MGIRGIIWTPDTWFSNTCLILPVRFDHGQVSSFLWPWFLKLLKSLDTMILKVSYMLQFYLKNDSMLSQNSLGNKLMYCTGSRESLLCAWYLWRLLPFSDLPNHGKISGSRVYLEACTSFKIKFWVLGSWDHWIPCPDGPEIPEDRVWTGVLVGVHTCVPEVPCGCGDGPRVGREGAKPSQRHLYSCPFLTTVSGEPIGGYFMIAQWQKLKEIEWHQAAPSYLLMENLKWIALFFWMFEVLYNPLKTIMGTFFFATLLC